MMTESSVPVEGVGARLRVLAMGPYPTGISVQGIGPTWPNRHFGFVLPVVVGPRLDPMHSLPRTLRSMHHVLLRADDALQCEPTHRALPRAARAQLLLLALRRWRRWLLLWGRGSSTRRSVLVLERRPHRSDARC